MIQSKNDVGFFARPCLLVLLLILVYQFSFAQEGSSTGQIDLGSTSPAQPGFDNIVFTGKSKSKPIVLRNKNEAYLVLDWVSPQKTEGSIHDDQLDIKIKLFSSSPINKDQVSVYNNQIKVSSKADEVSLFGRQNEFTYTNTIRLQEGNNEIEIEAQAGTLVKKTTPLVVQRTGDSLSFVTSEVKIEKQKGLNIYWWSDFDPLELNGKAYSIKQKELEIKLKILTSDTLLLENVNIVHNGNILTPSNRAELKGRQGSYNFSDFLSLDEDVTPNEIYIKVADSNRQADSEILNVNYSPLRPNLHILSIGTKTNLDYTIKDARDFAATFTGQGGATGNKIFNHIELDTLLGDNATAAEIKGTIEEFKVKYSTRHINKDDLIMIFISSHGFLMDDEFRIQGDDYSPIRKKSTSVSYKNDILSVLDKVPCKKIIFIDACHSGGARANASDINFELEKLNNTKAGLTVIASSRGEEESYEDEVWENGAFTEAIIKALQFEAADQNKDQIITLHELYSFLSSEVPTLVNTVKSRSQNPMIINDDLGDVAIYTITN